MSNNEASGASKYLSSIIQSKTAGKFSMFLSGTFMGLVGLFVSYFNNRSVYSAVALRGLFGFCWLLILILSLGIGKNSIELFKKYPIPILLQAVFSALTVYFYFSAIIQLNFAEAAFLLYLGPVITVIFNDIFLKVKIIRRAFIAFPIAIFGLAMILNIHEEFIINVGIFNGIMAALCLAISNTIKNYAFQRIKRDDCEINAILIHSLMPLFVCLVLTLMFIFQSDIITIPLTLPELIVGILMGLIPTALGFLFYNIGLNQDKGGDVIILSYSEPIVASILSILIQNIIDPLFYLGGALIIIANMILLFGNNKSNERHIEQRTNINDQVETSNE
jgi:drug/metabolite transporter (DMT)-like permease